MANIQIINADCMEAMVLMKDKEFDLAICDPPYNIVSQLVRGIGSRIDPSGKMNEWNHKKPDKLYFDELFRVSNCCIIWGANNFELPPSEYFIIWDKHQTVANFASAEYAWTNVKMPAKVFHYSVHQMMRDQRKIHPTQKPVALYQWLLKNYAKQGDRILDTHGGSCSSAIACDIMGFSADIYEIDKDYYEAALDRFNRHKQQQVIDF